MMYRVMKTQIAVQVIKFLIDMIQMLKLKMIMRN